ncbi:2-oxoglutarate (2OG) and Fe(II)-dependent oxygenase-like protein [Zostera marina]|uniref:2-oxoglutarate (2OG) and Fe(II)-dependent oxygenase-like protein n=1 Tax=Zostera marina TaxID=29655 RepID=A0A0K9P1H1_ZOSMR|nr:2-oxoglutarate (2OG) and Fe(II)-dependent oxygenase-like protein [Zostera marina]
MAEKEHGDETSTFSLDEIERIRVQELTEKTNGIPPDRFIQNESNRPISDLPLAKVPVIDLSLIESNDFQQRQQENFRLKSASLSWGLFQVVEYGIPISLLDDVRNITRLFFQQPPKEKQMYSSDGKVPDWNEGYGSDAILSHDQILDWNDKLYLFVYPEKAKNMDLWPPEPKSFREIANAFTQELMMLIDKVFKALARNLGLDDNYFIDNGAKGRISERFTYYPHCSKPDLVLGLKPHSDASSLTIILQEDKVPGLQVYNNELGWAKVPTLPNALLVFIGDEMEIMSNGQYKSPIHRVVTDSERDRISLTAFVFPESEKELRPVDYLIEEGKPTLYKKMLVKDYEKQHLLDFTQGKISINSMKA